MQRTRQLVIAALALGGVAVFARLLDHVYPLRTWLAWETLTVWAWVALLHAGCLGLGARVTIDWLRVRDRPALETLTLAMAVGVVGWVLLLYILGALGLFGRGLALLLPPLALAGLAPLRSSLPRWRDERRAAGTAKGALPTAIAAFGLLCLGLVYLQVFSPDALNYDSTWCHLTVAQDYAREGRIVPFAGDYAKNLPQLTPMLHLLGFVVPGLSQPLRWMFALHDELAMFLWTLVGISAGVRWVVGGAAPGGGWVTFFLFPGIFVYDSNLGGAADHVLAFFALPILFTTARLGTRPTLRNAVLWGLVCGGALLTKYQALYVLLPAAGLLVVLWVVRNRPVAQAFGPGSPAEPARLLPTALVAGAVLAAVAAPPFLRNLVFYKNPVYPFLQGWFTSSTPHVQDGGQLVSHVFTDVNWRPKGGLAERLINAGKLFFTFSFVPHYDLELRHEVPYVGSLFTLIVPLAPFLGKRPRLWATLGLASAALSFWALNFVVDRNLQTFLPLLVVATGAVIVLVWRAGPIARVGLVPLVAVQVVWGGDTFFRSGRERIDSALDLIQSGYDGDAATRFDGYRSEYVKLGEALPADATVLLHGWHMHLGIDRRVVLDWAGFQGMFDYRTVRSLAELDALYRARGVTHLVRRTSPRLAPTKQEEVLFALYVDRCAKPLGAFGDFQLFALPARPPLADPRDRVVMSGVAGYEDGVYSLEQLGAYENLLDVPPAFPRPRAPLVFPAAALVRDSLAVVIGEDRPSAPELVAAASSRALRLVPAAGELSIYRPY